MKRVLSGIAIAFLMSAQAGAAELVTTAGASVAPQVAAPAAALPLDGAVRPVADEDAGAALASGEGRCRAAAPAADPDHQVHGEVWAGVGTHGYRDVGTAMTAPVGRCGSVSIAIDRSEGSFGGWRR
jgi:hypothetical protein